MYLHVGRQVHDGVTSTVPGPTHVHDLVRYVGIVNGLRVQRLSMLPGSALIHHKSTCDQSQL